jgi:hypothetical protein
MAFDSSKSHGTAIGGQTHGCFIQDGKTYTRAGVEVDGTNGKPLKAAPAPTPAAKPAAVATGKTAAQVAAEQEIAAQAKA